MSEMRKIKSNKIRCGRCGEMPGSVSAHDFKFC